MYIDRIKLRNWRRIESLDLSFQPGINLVYGPNETGKSTIIEAIRMGLSGNPAGGGKEYRQLIPWGSTAKASVELDIQATDNTLYRIYKSFPKGEARLTIPAKGDLELASNATDTQKHLNGILGIESELHNLWNLLFVKQGEVLDIMDPDRKKKLLDPGLKLHIEEILRETAQKELNHFQQTLEKRLSEIFTATGKLSKKSDYYRLLMEERDSGEELERLETLERELLEKVKELEAIAPQRNGLEQTIKEQTLVAGQLERKKETAAALATEELKYKPLDERYHRLREIGIETKNLERELPLLLEQRLKLIETLTNSINNSIKRQTEAELRLEHLKIKKAAAVVCDTNRRSLEKVAGLHHDIKELQGDIERHQAILPRLSHTARDVLKQELANIETRLEAVNRLKREISATERRLKETIPVKEEEIGLIRRKAARLSKNKGTMEAARSRLELKLRIQPIQAEAIDISIRKDNGSTAPLSISKPTDIANFLRLEVEDPDRYRLHFSGSLKELDLQGLEAAVAELESDLQQAFGRFKVRDLQALETHYQDYLKLDQQLDGLRRQLKDTENTTATTQRKADIETQLKRVETLQKDYPLTLFDAEEPIDSGKDPVREAFLVSDRLDDLRKRLDDKLEGTSLQQLELAHRRLQEDVQASERRLMVMEPPDIPLVEERHLEEQIKAESAIQRDIDRLSEQKTLLEEMNLDANLKPASTEDDDPAGVSPRELRDRIDRWLRKLDDLKEEEKRMLGQETAEALRDKFLAADSRVRDLKRQLEDMPPNDAASPQEITARRQTVIKKIDELDLELKQSESKHHRLLGEISGFSANAIQKDNEAVRHRKLLSDMNLIGTMVLALPP